MGKHTSTSTSTQPESYQPKHERTGHSADNASRITGRLASERAAGR